MITLNKLRPRLGKTFIDRLTGDVVLSIGSQTYSRDGLVRELKVGNFAAARRLGKVLEELEITRVEDLASLAPEDLARVRGVGETTVYVLLCLQDALRQKPLEWDTTWSTYAHHIREPKKKKPSKRQQKIAARVARARATIANAQQPAATS